MEKITKCFTIGLLLGFSVFLPAFLLLVILLQFEGQLEYFVEQTEFGKLFFRYFPIWIALFLWFLSVSSVTFLSGCFVVKRFRGDRFWLSRFHEYVLVFVLAMVSMPFFFKLGLYWFEAENSIVNTKYIMNLTALLNIFCMATLYYGALWFHLDQSKKHKSITVEQENGKPLTSA